MEPTMPLRRTVALAFAALGALAPLACSTVQPTPTAGPDAQEPAFVLRGRVVDGTGAPALEDGVVVVDGDRIACVGAAGACAIPKGARQFDAEGGTILPGLIDLHAHVRQHYLWMFLAAGVTSVRDMNNDFDIVDAIGHDGPDRARIFWSGPLLDGERSVIAQAGARISDASSPEAARASVDTLAARGMAVVKLYEQIPLDAYRAAVARARELGLPTATDLGIQITRGLSGAEVDALQAIEAGVTSIEHMSGFALAYQRLGGDPVADPLDPALVDSLARAVVRGNVAVVPTLVTLAAFAAESLDFVDRIPLHDRLPEGLGEWWTQLHGSISPAARERARADVRLATALVRRVHELGGLIGAGSDTPAGPFDIPGGGLHREMELLVGAGLSPMDAIRAATGNAARILGRDDLGVIAPGKIADLVVVDGDPTRDIRDTRRIRWVFKAGRLAPALPHTPASTPQ
jgi:imidazolonepropionase-like amidohydrolase